MEPAQIKHFLQDGDSTKTHGFAILKSISLLLGADEKEERLIGQDLVIRLLERLEELKQYKPLVNALLRQAGLFPYLDEDSLDSVSDQMAYEFHRVEFDGANEVVFHREQAKIFELLMDGANLVVSAPTSFGKSLIIDSVISSGKYQNIAIVVPTIALIDETRRRLSGKFNETHKIITHQSQPLADGANILVLTQERAIERDDLNRVEFFIIDEFYKLDARHRNDGRALALNQAFYKLVKKAKQYYLLGPNVNSVTESFLTQYKGELYKTDFVTVASDIIKRNLAEGESQEADFIKLAFELKNEQTVVFCKSPPSAKRLAALLLESEYSNSTDGLTDFSQWLSDNYHSEWIFTKALQHGIGIHHGKIPRALSQYVVHLFNEKKIKVLICTSTLIEGVNTAARNIVIYDKKINSKALDFFTWSNIKGRAGRMFQHYVGKVYIYEDPPASDVLHVQVPLSEQDESTPCSLLVQLDSSDLAQLSKTRLEAIYRQDVLSIGLIKRHSHIEPDILIRTAEQILTKPDEYCRRLCWNKEPTDTQLYQVCTFIGKYLVPAGVFGDSVLTGRQLANRIIGFRRARSYSAYLKTVIEGTAKPEEISDAIEQTLDFIRNWLMFHVPKYFMTLNAILDEVMPKVGFPSANYSYFVSALEHMFTAPEIVALDEYGLPVQIGEKLIKSISAEGNLDLAIKKLASVQPHKFDMTPFEQRVLSYVQESL